MSMSVDSFDSLIATYFPSFQQNSVPNYKYELLQLTSLHYSDVREFWTKEVPSLGIKIDCDGINLRFSVWTPKHRFEAYIFEPSPKFPNVYQIFLMDTERYNVMDKNRLVERHFEIDLMNYVLVGRTFRVLLGIVDQNEGCILGEITL